MKIIKKIFIVLMLILIGLLGLFISLSSIMHLVVDLDIKLFIIGSIFSIVLFYPIWYYRKKNKFYKRWWFAFLGLFIIYMINFPKSDDQKKETVKANIVENIESNKETIIDDNIQNINNENALESYIETELETKKEYEEYNDTINETIKESISERVKESKNESINKTKKESSTVIKNYYNTNNDKSNNTVQEIKKETTQEVKKDKKLPNKISKAYIKRVIDGDTVEAIIDNNQYKVRLIGIDSPETKHPKKGLEYYGKESTNYATNNLLNKTVYLEKDVSETDKYGRLLRYIWFSNAINNVNFESPSNKDIEKYMFNAHSLKKGYSQSSSYAPDIKYQNIFHDLARDARIKEIGLWNESNTISVDESNTKKEIENENYSIQGLKNTDNSSNDTEKQYVDENGKGLIKGNINSKGEKIYHTPYSRSYKKTKINTSKGEKWFRTENEAKAAGWRAPKN